MKTTGTQWGSAVVIDLPLALACRAKVPGPGFKSRPNFSGQSVSL